MPKKYLYQSMTSEYKASLHANEGGNSEDSRRAYENRSLTNEQIMSRVKDAIQMELAQRSIEQHRTDEIIAHDWNMFVTSKLVNPKHNKFI